MRSDRQVVTRDELARFALSLIETSRDKEIRKLVVYLGRYAHQQRAEMLKLTVRELYLMAEEVAEILTAEKKAGGAPEE